MKWNKKKVFGIGATLFAVYLIPFSIFTAKTVKQINQEDSIEFVVNNQVVKSSSSSDNNYLLNGENASKNADLIEIGFYKNALYGFGFDDETDDPSNPTDGSIIQKYSGLLDVYGTQSTFYNNYYDSYVIAQIFQNTTMANKSLSVYVGELVQQNEELKTPEVLAIIAGEYQNLSDLLAGGITPGITAAFEQIKNIDSFRLSANIFLYETMFLFQESTSGKYDFRLTEIMASNPMSLVWYATLNNLESLGTDRDLIESALTINDVYSIYETTPSGTQTINDIDVEKNKSLFGDMGFQGLVSSSGSSLTLETDFWDYSNSWIITSDVDDNNFAAINAGEYNTSVNNHFYLENGTNKIVTGDNRNSGYVVRSRSLYPFVFAYNYNQAQNTASKYYYSLFASEETPGTYKYINVNDIDPSTTTSILDVLYDNLATDVITIDPAQKMWYNAYFLINIINSSSNTLLNAQNYWRNRGYYIKLNGEYKKIYGSEIDSGIQEI